MLKLHKKLKKEGKWPDAIPLKIKGTEVKSVLQKVIGEVETLPKADKDDMETIKIAVDFEAKGLSYTRGGTGKAILLYTGTSALLPRGT